MLKHHSSEGLTINFNGSTYFELEIVVNYIESLTE